MASMSTLWEECFSRKILIGGWPFGMTVGTQAKWLVRTAVSRAGKNLQAKHSTSLVLLFFSQVHTQDVFMYF